MPLFDDVHFSTFRQPLDGVRAACADIPRTPERAAAAERDLGSSLPDACVAPASVRDGSSRAIRGRQHGEDVF